MMGQVSIRDDEIERRDGSEALHALKRSIIILNNMGFPNLPGNVVPEESNAACLKKLAEMLEQSAKLGRQSDELLRSQKTSRITLHRRIKNVGEQLRLDQKIIIFIGSRIRRKRSGEPRDIWDHLAHALRNSR